MKSRIRMLIPVLLICWIAVVLFTMLSMNSANPVLRFLRQADTRPAPTPKAFGAFHFLWVCVCILCVLFTILAAWRIPFGSSRKKQAVVDRTVFVSGILFLVLELYKQFFYWFVLNGRQYYAGIFPFQFCSLPIYFCLFAPLIPSPAIRNAFYRFLALFGTVGGYLVIGFPNLPDVIALCLHTMIWHTLMISLGAFLLVAMNCGERFARDMIPTTAIFLSAFLIAVRLNRVLIPLEAGGGQINLFYMSPRYPVHYFIIRTVRADYGWVASLVCYVLLFVFAGAFPLWILGKLFCFFRRKRRKRDATILK